MKGSVLTIKRFANPHPKSLAKMTFLVLVSEVLPPVYVLTFYSIKTENCTAKLPRLKMWRW